jgi:hypothetical protein
MENVSKNACNCGNVDLKFYPDENHYEPACWECYHNPPTWIYEAADDEEYELPF